MTQWLMDTFVWTSALIALALVLRRPVARYFGPQVAYALWVLPLLRLAMPPLVLPASFRPATDNQAGEAAALILADAPAAVAVSGFTLTDLILPLWLGGAVLFLVWRASDYARMRRELLAQARPMGEAGAVRLVETPEVVSPVAFGLRDKVVALPPGFMAQHNIAARDLALAHELAHHRGHDLLANLLAQPLLALHWFNPLAWAGWRAMRSDQEAACDARVIVGRERSERAVYAQVIAGFAAGPRLALAAPMACPVLGEKSIIHRLRSLTMTDVSSTRRKLGLAAIGAGALVALPLTASISYAQNEEAAEAVPQRIERIRVQRVEGEGEAAEAGETQIRQRIVIRRDAPVAVAPVEEAELAQGGEPPVRQRIIIRHDSDDNHGLAPSARDWDAGCGEGEVESRSTSEDGSRETLICRKTLQRDAVSAMRSAQRAIEGNGQLPLEDRERVVRELEAQIEALEAEEVSFSPVHEAKPMVAMAGVPIVRIRLGDHAILLIPEAKLRVSRLPQ